METKLLLSNKYKTIGMLLLVISVALGIMVHFWDFEISFLTLEPSHKKAKIFDERMNFTDEVALTGIIMALLFIAFAREKIEDEFINRTRLESWQWAILINYIMLVIATWAVYGFAFLDVMMYNMLTIPIIFIIRFHYVLYKNKALTEI